LEISKASVLAVFRRHAFVRALYSVSFVSLVWFLYWIGYDVVVWKKPLVGVNLFNYAGAVLSLAAIVAEFGLRAKTAVGTSNDGQDEEHGTVEGRGVVEVETHAVERCGEGEEPSVLYDLEGEGSSLLRGLEEEERSLTEEKRDLLALKERLELEAREKIEAGKRSVDTLKSEVAELKRQIEQLKFRLRTME
jgi:hypothetical protein